MTAVILTWMMCEEVTLLTVPWLSSFPALGIQLKQLYFYSTEQKIPQQKTEDASKPDTLNTNCFKSLKVDLDILKKAYIEQLQLTINN